MSQHGDTNIKRLFSCCSSLFCGIGKKGYRPFSWLRGQRLNRPWQDKWHESPPQSLTWHFENNSGYKENRSQMMAQKVGKGGTNRFLGRVTQGEVCPLDSWMGKGRWDWESWNLLAHIDPLCEATLLAQHIATPVKSTIAALTASLSQDVVSTATAQWAAAVCAVAGFVADASLCTWRVYRGIMLTEIRRLLKVNQLSEHASTTTSVESPCAPAGAISCSRVENPIVLVLGVDKDGWQELFFE